MDKQEALKGIRLAARQRGKASEARGKATDELRRYCIAAREANVPISQIALEANLSRQGVYDLLRESPDQ